MTNLSDNPQAMECQALAEKHCIKSYPTRATTLGGGLTIRRALPTKEQRMVGPWCFLDHFGPLALDKDSPGMQVGPHPHIGLQTVTWLFEGEVLHRDSLGFEQRIRPGQLNLMTGGEGISHSEETPSDHGQGLHGLQFWVALPSDHKAIAPGFEHHENLPRFDYHGLTIHLFAGEMLGERSPATYYSPIVGADILATDTRTHRLPLNPDFEHALLITEGELIMGEETLVPDVLYYLGNQREEISFRNDKPARFGVFGGAPLAEKKILWWNFVGDDFNEIEQARNDWEDARQGADTRFGHVEGYPGDPLAAPTLENRLK